MFPKSKTQNVTAWVASVVIALLVSFLTALAQELPGTNPINWRAVILAVINTAISIAPLVAIGLGLPALGKETITHNNIDYGKLADIIVRKHNAQQQIQQQADTSS